jgi:hypothetical protein
MHRSQLCLGCVALAILGCASPSLDAPLGSPANPVRAATYLGEFEYLTRLECPDGTKPHLRRLPGRKKGPYGNQLVGYRVRCIYLNRETRVFIDSHHATYLEHEPVVGFGFSRPPDMRRLFWLQ